MTIIMSLLAKHSRQCALQLHPHQDGAVSLSSSHGLPLSSFPGLSFGLSTFSVRCVVCVVVRALLIMMMMCVPAEALVGFNGGSLTRTLQTLEGYSCEGGTLGITCPPSTLISVQYAKYGRSVPSDQMCPRSSPLSSATRVAAQRWEYDDELKRFEPRTSNHGFGGGGGDGGDYSAIGVKTVRENTNCLAIRSLEVLLDLCEDKANCQVLAESTTFRQDPCPDTFKYLEVHYKCRPNEFEQRTVCEGEQMELSCKKSRRIAIYSALFGRIPNGTGPCPPNRPGYINCRATQTVSEVRTACQGRKSCGLQASEAVFGNPCAAGINKYLTVTFACVPKKILKEIRRHRGRLGPNRKKKKKKKKEQQRKKKKGKVTKLPSGQGVAETTTSTRGGSGETSSARGGLLEPPQSTQLLETYHSTDSAEEKASADTAAGGEKPVTFHPYYRPSSSSPPLVPVANREPPSDRDSPWYNSGRELAEHDGDQRGSEGREDNLPGRDSNHFDSNVNSRDPYSVNNHDSDISRPKKDRDGDTLSSDFSQDNFGSHRDRSKDFPGQVRPGFNHHDSRNNSVSATKPGVNSRGQGKEGVSTAAPDTVGGHSVTEDNMTALSVNHTGDLPTVRTLPTNSEAPLGVVRELFCVLQFVQGHQEKAILYLVLGMCVGLIILLTVVLGRVCYKLKHNTHAKLDMTEPTHSRNVSHLVHHMNHHSMLETPMLEHSDSIDRIEVVRFEPRGTLRSGYHSTLHSDSGDRSLNNYYG